MAKKTPTTKRKPTAQQEKFVEAMVDPQTKNPTQAAKKAGCPENSARVQASKWLANPNIVQNIENRKKALASFVNIKNEMIIGAAIREAFSSIDDVYDARGNFDIKKARRTGAIHHIKSITRTPNKYGEAVKVEMYSAAEARKEVADYLGIKQLPRENEEKVKNTVAAIRDYIETHPSEDRQQIIDTFARGRGVPVEVIHQHLDKIN